MSETYPAALLLQVDTRLEPVALTEPEVDALLHALEALGDGSARWQDARRRLRRTWEARHGAVRDARLLPSRQDP